MWVRRVRGGWLLTSEKMTGTSMALRSPEVEEENTKASLEIERVAARDFEHFWVYVVMSMCCCCYVLWLHISYHYIDSSNVRAQPTYKQVASSPQLDRKVISAQLAVSHDSGPWEGCIIRATCVGIISREAYHICNRCECKVNVLSL